MAHTTFQLQKKPKSRRKFYFAGAAIVVLTIAVVAALELTNTTHIFHKGVPATKVIVKAGNQSQASDANSSSDATTPTPSASQPEKTATSTNSVNQGAAIDSHGQASNTDPKQWVVSTSGNITVKQPAANATLKSGNVLGGSAKVGQIQYRLIDNKVGVIAQGSLGVVNGNFSGSLQFSPKGSSGRLDVFSLDANGAEINEVQITVGF